jgi:molecular chaperone DnaJ
MKDYYSILNLDRNATTEEIKKSYKKLALLYHPDKNQGNAEATEKFKEVSEAYSVLSNDDKRKQYNVMGSADDDFGMGEDPFAVFNSIFKQHLSSFMNMKYDNDVNVSNIFSNLSGMPQGNFPFGNVHIRVHTFPTDVFETNQVQDNYENNYQNNYENRYEQLNEEEKIIHTKPDNIVQRVIVSFADIYNKETKKVNITHMRKKSGSYIEKKKSIDIPIYGKEVILEGFGNEIKNHQNRGDVIINIFTKKSKKFKRINEYDILVYHQIDLEDVYKNIEFKVKLPNDEIINIKNEKLTENSDNNLIQKVIGKGIPYRKDDANKEDWSYGDLYIIYKIKFPVKENEDKKEDTNNEKENINAVNCSINDILNDE